MGEVARRPRADAERNRRRLLDAAAELFGERGLDVGVAEIAQRAGVGRATLFRNFPTKEDLIAAIVVDAMSDAAGLGHALLEAPAAGQALFTFLEAAAPRIGLDLVARGTLPSGAVVVLVSINPHVAPGSTNFVKLARVGG